MEYNTIMERKLTKIDNFGSGELSSLAPEKIEKTGAVVAKNGIIDIDNSFRKRLQNTLFQTLGTAGSTVIIQRNYDKSNGKSYSIVATSDGRVFYMQYGDDNEYVEITGFASDFGDTSPVKILSFSDVAWLIDGKYAYTWDGTTLTRVDSGGTGALWSADFDGAKYIVSAHGLIYMAGYATDSSAVYYSSYYDATGSYVNPTSADAWDALNIFKLPVDGQVITGLASFKDILLVFTKDKVWALNGEVAIVSSALKEIYSYSGCISAGSIAEVNNTLYWVGKGGVYAFDGGSIKIISMGIRDYFEWMKYAGNYEINYIRSTKTDFEKFVTLQHADNQSSYNAIVPQLVPAFNDDDSYMEKSPFVAYTKYAMKFKCGSDIDGNISVGVLSRCLQGSFTADIYICTDYLDPVGSAITHGTSTLSIPGAFGMRYASFTDVALHDVNTYYIVIDGDGTDFDLYTRDNYDIDSYALYGYAGSPSSWFTLTDTSKIAFIRIIPANMTIDTDIFYMDNVYNTGKLLLTLDSSYYNESEDVTLYYRYSKTSQADVYNQSWVEVDNNVYPAFTYSQGDDMWVQFRLSLGTDVGTSNRELSDICPRVLSLLFGYTSGTSLDLSMYGFGFEHRYYLSIPEQGKTSKEKVFVLNHNGSWTWLDLHANSIWSQDNMLTYGLSDMNSIIQLTEFTNEISDEWNSQAEWQSYALDNYCDDTTSAGSLITEETNDIHGYSDSFDGSSVDAKWLNNATAGYTESDGVLWVTISNPNELHKVYQNIIGTDYSVSVKIGSDGIPNDTNATEVVGMMLDLTRTATDISYTPVTGYLVYLWRNVADGFLKTKVLGYENGVLSSTTNGDTGGAYSGAYIWVKITKEISGSNCTLSCYWSDDADAEIPTWNLIVAESFVNSNLNRVSLSASMVTTEVYAEYDDFVFTGNAYPDGAYRIFQFNSSGDATLYWEASDCDDDNTISIYHSLRPSSSAPDEYTLNDIYEWEEITEITSTTLTGNEEFTTSPYHYIKVVFNNTDTTETAKLDRLYIITDEEIDMLWETPMLEMDDSDKEKYIRKLYMDAETEGNFDIYYQTEKMTGWRHQETTGTDTRVSLSPEHGKKIKFRFNSNNALPCKFKHFTIEYKEHKHR